MPSESEIIKFIAEEFSPDEQSDAYEISTLMRVINSISRRLSKKRQEAISAYDQLVGGQADRWIPIIDKLNEFIKGR